jgi:hypothetical protein
MNFAQFARFFSMLEAVTGVAADAVTAVAASDTTHPALNKAAAILEALEAVLPVVEKPVTAVAAAIDPPKVMVRPPAV